MDESATAYLREKITMRLQECAAGHILPEARLRMAELFEQLSDAAKHEVRAHESEAERSHEAIRHSVTDRLRRAAPILEHLGDTRIASHELRALATANPGIEVGMGMTVFEALQLLVASDVVTYDRHSDTYSRSTQKETP